jgi:hypothetical protein
MHGSPGGESDQYETQSQTCKSADEGQMARRTGAVSGTNCGKARSKWDVNRL